MSKKGCPKCKSSDGMSVELKQNYELAWSTRHNEFEIGDANTTPTFENDSKVTCNCGWSGKATPPGTGWPRR